MFKCTLRKTCTGLGGKVLDKLGADNKPKVHEMTDQEFGELNAAGCIDRIIEGGDKKEPTDEDKKALAKPDPAEEAKAKAAEEKAKADADAAKAKEKAK